MNTELIAQIDALIDTVMDMAVARGIVVSGKLPRRQWQAVILTSEAFYGMSHAEAANAMGIEEQVVDNYVSLARQNPNIASFMDAWSRGKTGYGSLHSPLNIDWIDETEIVRTF